MSSVLALVLLLASTPGEVNQWASLDGAKRVTPFETVSSDSPAAPDVPSCVVASA